MSNLCPNNAINKESYSKLHEKTVGKCPFASIGNFENVVNPHLKAKVSDACPKNQEKDFLSDLNEKDKINDKNGSDEENENEEEGGGCPIMNRGIKTLMLY